MSAVQLAVDAGAAALILLAYLLLSAGRLTGQSLVYQGMNIVGAAGFVMATTSAFRSRRYFFRNIALGLARYDDLCQKLSLSRAAI